MEICRKANREGYVVSPDDEITEFWLPKANCVKVLTDEVRVKLNTANRKELSYVCDSLAQFASAIGSTPRDKARQILANILTQREQRAFEGWDDLEERVKGVGDVLLKVLKAQCTAGVEKKKRKKAKCTKRKRKGDSDDDEWTP